MADSGSLGLLDLSAELRLMVYGHLLDDSLASGCSTGLAGLYLSCRTVHRELEKELVFKTRPLLNRQYKWKKNFEEHENVVNLVFEPISLKLSYKGLLSKTTAVDLTIILPVVMIKHRIELDTHIRNFWKPMPRMVSESALFKRLVKIVAPILRLPWSTLHIDFSNNTATLPDPFELGMSISETFFLHLARLYRGCMSFFSHISMLILSFGDAEGVPYYEYFGCMFNDLFLNGIDDYEVTFCFLPESRRTWIARKQGDEGSQRDWRLVYDFENDWRPVYTFEAEPGKVEGALWAMFPTYGGRRSKRLFTEIDGGVPEEFERDLVFQVEYLHYCEKVSEIEDEEKHSTESEADDEEKDFAESELSDH